MDSERVGNVHPAMQPHMTRGGFTQTVPNPKTGEPETKVMGVDRDGNVDNLLRYPFYPVQDIDVLTRQVDGVVEMKAVTNNTEMAAAQAFLFPKWADIVDGTLALPTRVSQLKAYFLRRLEQANASGEKLYIAVAKAAIMSCDQFTTWGHGFARGNVARYREAQVKGWAWNIGSDMELVCEQIGLARPDMVEQTQADRLDQLTEVLMTQAQTTQKLIDLSLTKETGATETADTPPPAVPQTPADAPAAQETANGDGTTDEPPQTCLATTAKGDPCKNVAEADGFCKREDHNAANEAKKLEDADEEERKKAENGG